MPAQLIISCVTATLCLWVHKRLASALLSSTCNKRQCSQLHFLLQQPAQCSVPVNQTNTPGPLCELPATAAPCHKHTLVPEFRFSAQSSREAPTNSAHAVIQCMRGSSLRREQPVDAAAYTIAVAAHRGSSRRHIQLGGTDGAACCAPRPAFYRVSNNHTTAAPPTCHAPVPPGTLHTRNCLNPTHAPAKHAKPPHRPMAFSFAASSPLAAFAAVSSPPPMNSPPTNTRGTLRAPVTS